MEHTTDNFKWNDELVKEYCASILEKRQYSIRESLDLCFGFDKFKQSKVKKEEPKPEWEIRSYSGDAYGMADVSFNKMPDGRWCSDYRLGWSEPFEDNVLPKNKLKIKSVRRLSDGEVFSIGDIVGWDLIKLPGNNHNIFKIDSFQIMFGRMFCNNQNICIDNITKPKPEEPKQKYGYALDVDKGTTEELEALMKLLKQFQPYSIPIYNDKEQTPKPEEPLPINVTDTIILGQAKEIVRLHQELKLKKYTSDELLEAQQKNLDIGYNMGIDHAIGITESNLATLNYGNQATRNPEILCNQIINFLKNLKK